MWGTRRNVTPHMLPALRGSLTAPPTAPMIFTAMAATYFVDPPRASSSSSPALNAKADEKNSKHTSSDCVSSTALLVYRGLGAGLAWTIGVDGYALLNAPNSLWEERIAGKKNATIPKEMAKSFAWLCGRNMFGFASFLGIFGGVSCSLEKLRGKNDLLNPFFGGFSAGLALLPGELRSPRAILTSATLCGVASMGFHFFIPSTGHNKSEGEYEAYANAEREGM
ncbi:Mitochondrial inner membrane translocase subunit tim17/tim22/tim23/peroxisomal protein pmp24 [Globisporangium polare]